MLKRHTNISSVIRNRRGAALVEFAIVAMLLLTLVFGIIDYGLLIKDQLTLSEAVREGVRSAALGKTTTEISNVVATSASTMDTTKISNIQVYYRDVTNNTGWLSGLPDPSSTAAHDIQMKVSADYSHAMIMGNMFGSNPKTLHSEMVMRTE